MQAETLYAQLEKDFIKPGLSDEWAKYMQPGGQFLSENYKKRSMGLVCDNASEIKSVFTAVFPTLNVMQFILDLQVSEAMLFVHHPEIWDIRCQPVFQQMDLAQLKLFKERRIAIYNLHVPLDNYSRYSTGYSLAKALGLEIEKPFAAYYGALAGILARTDLTTVQELRTRYSAVMGHQTSLYHYGDETIKGGKVAIAAGGGNLVEILQETADAGINTYITGVTVRYVSTEKSHRFAMENSLNLLGGTHYSTEKPACQAMVGYFQALGLKAEFVEGQPLLGDL